MLSEWRFYTDQYTDDEEVRKETLSGHWDVGHELVR
jgi:hypothetical protein